MSQNFSNIDNDDVLDLIRRPSKSSADVDLISKYPSVAQMMKKSKNKS